MVAARESTAHFQDTEGQGHASSFSVCFLVNLHLSEGTLILTASKLCGFFLYLALIPAHLLSSHRGGIGPSVRSPQPASHHSHE